MPEGPEIRREADAIAAAIAGLPIERLELVHPRLAPHARRLRGAKLRDVESRGKALLLRFDNGLTLYSHNLLFGRWYVVPLGRRPKTQRTLRVAIATAAHEALLYSASEVALLDDEGVASHAYLSKLGPDLLDPKLTATTIARRLADPRFRRRNLAALLLDQSFLAGNGNYLRSEMLWEAKLHPMRRAMSLTAAERARFARAILKIGQRAYRNRGVTNDPARIARLKKANPRRSYRYACYTRDGEPCYRCGAEIVREVATTRRIYRCPACQPADGAEPAKPPLRKARTYPRRGGTGTARGARAARRPRSSS